MIDRILEICRSTTYDFRGIASPDDPLTHLFPDWVPYYQLKAAIAQTIAPASILEIGVRYGYSAAAFFHGSPNTKYTGIDLDVDTFGGTKGAIAWAREILPAPQTEIILGNSQEMIRFPGSIYDLIHIDGQQDGDGTYRDLEKALCQGRYILLDGYYWTQQNFHAASEFLYQHRRAIDFSIVIPGYAGELLIRVKPEALLATKSSLESVNSLDLRRFYDAAYYQHDCSGWDSFAASHGKRLTNTRLRPIFDLAMSRNPKHLVDLGCGRGEISVAAARAGCQVFAVDYAKTAIDIARKLVEDEPSTANRILWSCSDATTIIAEPKADVIIAADLLEHLAHEETSRLFAHAAIGLAPSGCLVVHVSSNKWICDYANPNQRRQAAVLGAYLPPSPYSPFGRQLRISEQSPARLRRQLRQHFRHVLLWLGNPENPVASLAQKLRPRILAAQPYLFAIASNQPIDVTGILQLFASPRLPEAAFLGVIISVAVKSVTARTSEKIELLVEISNLSDFYLCSQLPHPVYLCYHWLDASTGNMVIWEGERTPLVPALQPKQHAKHIAYCVAPPLPGNFRLQITLVQEGVQWFDRPDFSSKATVEVVIH